MESRGSAERMTGTVPSMDAGSRSERDEQLRAHTYSLLALLLNAPPGAQTLELLAGIDVDDGAQGSMAGSWAMLKLAGARVGQSALDDEYHALFVGITMGEVVPYGCWYLSGVLMDKPLVRLRQDLEYLGIERRADVHEPEDHAGALCETMALLCSEPEAFTPAMQREFFGAHIAPWMALFFRDLQKAPSACFYQAVGRLGEAFINFERQYLATPA
ncbi:MAG: molecular chaperone TorD family protein [Gammaproteobacteria bacterium]